MKHTDIDHYRDRAASLLADLTGVDRNDARVRELIECIEAAACAVIEKRQKTPAVIR